MNSSLTELLLWGMERYSHSINIDPVYCSQSPKDNFVGDEGALAFSDALKTNTVLTSLTLGCLPSYFMKLLKQLFHDTKQ